MNAIQHRILEAYIGQLDEATIEALTKCIAQAVIIPVPGVS